MFEMVKKMYLEIYGIEGEDRTREYPYADDLILKSGIDDADKYCGSAPVYVTLTNENTGKFIWAKKEGKQWTFLEPKILVTLLENPNKEEVKKIFLSFLHGEDPEPLAKEIRSNRKRKI